MPTPRESLRELQLAFARAVLADDRAGIAPRLYARGTSADARLAIYRNNTFSNLRSALRETYPVILRLVGDAFFDYAGNEFIQAHPSTSGDLNDFGTGFGEFLASWPPAAELPYLCDVARLEWAQERAYYAVDAAPLDLSRLAVVPPERYGELRLALHPAASLVASPYPVLRIWQVNQPGYEGEPSVDLGEGGVELLITRRALDVVTEPLSPGEFALLAALHDGEPLGRALDRAIQRDAAFDLQASLARRISLHDVVDLDFAQ
jgi:hypothetical protein